jgi:hypothetical protein
VSGGKFKVPSSKFKEKHGLVYLELFDGSTNPLPATGGTLLGRSSVNNPVQEAL